MICEMIGNQTVYTIINKVTLTDSWKISEMVGNIFALSFQIEDLVLLVMVLLLYEFVFSI